MLVRKHKAVYRPHCLTVDFASSRLRTQRTVETATLVHIDVCNGKGRRSNSPDDERC